MHGIYLHGRRPKSKAELKRAIAEDGFDPYSVVLEATSLFGGEFDGSLAKAERSLSGDYDVDAEGPRFRNGLTFVGPDPYTKRSFYGTVSWSESKGWVVK
jgi:hypothetical protein